MYTLTLADRYFRKTNNTEFSNYQHGLGYTGTTWLYKLGNLDSWCWVKPLKDPNLLAVPFWRYGNVRFV